MNNREIKFRAWDEFKKVMAYDIIVQDGMHTKYVESSHEGPLGVEECFGRIQSPKNPIMQFTGLKDKNGKEIYEGDIVDLFPESPDFRKGYAVVFEEGEFLLDVPAPMNRRISKFYEKVKVVGNIFENPELLK